MLIVERKQGILRVIFDRCFADEIENTQNVFLHEKMVYSTSVQATRKHTEMNTGPPP